MPLNVTEEKFFFFLLLLLEVGVVSLEVAAEVERRREEMVDLEPVDWIMEGICES